MNQLTLGAHAQGLQQSFCVSVCLSVCLSVYMYVCMSVCYHEICYTLHLYVENKLSYGSLWCFQGFCRVALAKNGSFNSSGIIWRSPLLSLLPDKLLIDRRDSDGFFSTKLVSRPSVSSYNTTDLSLITLKQQLSSRAPQLSQHQQSRTRDTGMRLRNLVQWAFLWFRAQYDCSAWMC